MFRKPLRTYERNPKPTSSIANVAFNDVELTFNRNPSDNRNSLESTFDRILKTAKLPPLPVQPLDNTEYTSSSSDFSDNEPLELIPIENPRFFQAKGNRIKQPKTVLRKNNNKKKLPKNTKTLKKKESTKRDHNNDEGANEGIEFPPLRKTRREENKPTVSEILVDKLPDKLDNCGTSVVTKDLKDCCVILTRMNLHDKYINNTPLSRAFSTNSSDNDNSIKISHDEKEILDSKKCRVILSRFDSETEQNDLQYKDALQQPKPVEGQSTNLLNVNSNVFSSTPFERRIMSRRSIPTLSPIKNNVNISVGNDHPAAVLFDKTSEIIFSDENSPEKNISQKRKVPRLSKIKEKITVRSKENNEPSTSMKTINIDDSTQNTFSHSLSMYEKTPKIVFDDSEEIIPDTYASVNVTDKKENSHGSNVSNSLSLSNDADVETSKHNETSVISSDDFNGSSEVNSEFKSTQCLEEISADSEEDPNTDKSKNNYRKISMESEIEMEKNQNLTELQSSISSTKNESSNDPVTMDVSENDDDSLHLVLSSTSSDKESTRNDSTNIEKNQDSSNSNVINVNNSDIDNNLNIQKEDCKNPGELVVLLTRLDDSVKIPESRITHRHWKQPLNVITESFDKSKNSNVSQNISARLDENKILFLKPGKSWARSLSILNNIHNTDDIEFLSLRKGKKWRQSVRNVLSMQSQGLLSSCVPNTEINKTFHETSQLYGPKISLSASHGANDSANRFTRRMTIRVVPNIKKNQAKEKVIHDTSFLEVYGITDILTDDIKKRTKKSISRVPRKTLGYNLRCSNVPERISPEPVISAKTVVFDRCNQKDSIPFDQCYPESYLKYCRKIGEGVYGEVFLYDHQKQKSVIKIIPIEGTELVNGETQKKFHEILSEIIIAKELHNLRFNDTYRTNGFVEVKNIRCIKGKYPQKLLDLWQVYDDEKNSENDCPSMFEENQLYIALELGDGGQDMEAFLFNNANEAYITFLQTALTLAVGERSLEFEHRDMHWGNILISRTKEKEVSYKLDNEEITLACNGIKVAIIDFTLSRMSYEGCCIFNDLALDPALFNAAGEYQFEIYRLMRAKIGNDWQLFEPYTNILWLHYTLDKMIKEVRYKKKTTKIHRTAIQNLQELKDIILDYNSAFDFISNCDKLLNLQRRCSNN
ncbi:uncharacterized protein [Chelonus insularis]|uniref:uncharacterized protein n=1 Tax=Chelonus insularis TaxID=460826 RepID=UPI00158AC385|nr:uncharacterized protein LOC118069669 [Chelonus insularis]XP_034943839.1 uncharacterized protein LOC118069669 [Chelonus insularis]